MHRRKDLMKKEMLINVLQPEEIRIAIVEDGVLEELYVERTSHESYVGNIYKGRIVNIEPSIQAAFVDFGVGRNGFLHVSDVEPAYYRHLEQGNDGGRRGRDRGRGGERNERGPRRPRREQPPEFTDVRDEFEEDILETPGEPLAAHQNALEWDAAMEPPGQDATLAGEEHDLLPGTPEHTEPAVFDEDKIAAADTAHPGTAEAPLTEAEKNSEEDGPHGRGRRRGRGRGRGRRGRGEKGPEERAEGVPEALPAPKPEDAPQDKADDGSPPRDWPRLMESAEHRTTGDDGKQDLPDEELSFSMRPPRETPEERRHEHHGETPAAREPAPISKS